MSARRGFALLPVVLALSLLAAIAYALSRESSGGTGRVGAAGQAAEARYVAEAGLRHALWLAHRSSCTGYGLPSTPFAGHSYAASFTPTSGSPVSVTATATLANGATHSLTRGSVGIVADLDPLLLVLPADGGDTTLHAGNPNDNYGAAPGLAVSSSGSEQRALLRFDVSGIPNGARIFSARLGLYFLGANSFQPGARIGAHRVTQSWVEGTGNSPADGATWLDYDGSGAWQSPGGDASVRPLALARLPDTAGSWVDWEIGPLVQAWVDGRAPNHGVLLRTDHLVNQAGFASGASAQPPQRPRLAISYGCECGAAGPSEIMTLQPGGAGEDTYVSDQTPLANYGTALQMRISDNNSRKENGLLRFDLNALPPEAIVASATLELFLEGIGSGGTADVAAHRVTRSWTELGATWLEARPLQPWTTPGGDYDPVPEDTVQIDAALPGLTQWDVTSLVQEWLGGTDNYGLLLKGAFPVDRADFSSGDPTSVPQHPKLILTYSCGCGPCPVAGFYLDGFETRTCDPAVDYSGSQGTLDWSPETWTEIGDGADPCTGPVRILDLGGDFAFRMSGNGRGVERAADLSTLASTWLTLEYRRVRFDDPSDHATIEVSTDGGANWVEVGRLEGPADDAFFETAYFDLNAPGVANAAIRLLNHSTATAQAEFHVTSVRIDDGSSVPPILPKLTLTPDADTWINEASPSTNYGSDVGLRSGASNSWQRYRSLLRFDPSALPPGATVVSATLRTFKYAHLGSQDSEVGVYRVTAPWVEANATWDSTGGQPFDPADPLDTTFVGWATSGWVTWDIPPGLIHEWIDGITPNHGLLIEYLGSKKNQHMTVRSREHSDSAQRPLLVIEYTEP